MFQFIKTFKIMSSPQTSTDSSQPDFHVQGHQLQEPESAQLIPNLLSGDTLSEESLKARHRLLFASNLMVLPTEDFENTLEQSEWLDIAAKLSVSQRSSLAQGIEGEGFLLYPTLTAGQATEKSKTCPGQVKLENWFNQFELIPVGLKLRPEAMCLIMGFPWFWVETIADSNWKNPISIVLGDYQGGWEPE